MQNINFILACERIAIEMGTIKNSISEILDLSYVAVIGGMKERYIPGTPVDFFNALRTSSNRNMILNEKGEVCYHIRLKGDIFQVYSRQSGIHYINGFGGIIDLDETYQLRQNNLLILREETIKLL